MKKLVLAALAASALVAVPAFAKPAPTTADPVMSSKANGNACFGQARAAYASTLLEELNLQSNGYYISQRAQSPATDGESPNLNVQMNREYIADNC